MTSGGNHYRGTNARGRSAVVSGDLDIAVTGALGATVVSGASIEITNGDLNVAAGASFNLSGDLAADTVTNGGSFSQSGGSTVVDAFDAVLAGREALVLRERGPRALSVTLRNRSPAELRQLFDRHDLRGLWLVEQIRTATPSPQTSDAIAPALLQRFADHGLRVARTLETPNVRAWRLERT